MKFNTEYKDEFAQIAFERLSKVPLRDENVLCLVFRCSRQTLALWKAGHTDFRTAIELGMMTGEYKFRALLFAFSLVSSRRVNTKLLTILASNVYGINEEQIKQIKGALHDGDISSLEERMEALGIPVPSIPIEDLQE